TFRSGKFYSTNVNGVLISHRGYSNKAMAEALNRVAFRYVANAIIPKLMNNVMEQIVFAYPPDLAEQNKISFLFKEIDEIVAESKKVSNIFLEIRNSLAYQMTANSLEEAPKLRFSSYKEKWKRVLLSDIVDIVGGGTPLTTNPEFWEGGTVNWFTPAEIENNKVYISDSGRKITEAGLKSSSAKILPINSVLFTSRASIGKAAILSAEASTNQGFQSLIPKEGKSLTYFIYLLTARVKDFALQNATGTTFLEVSSSTLKSMLVRIPSLEEQEKIAKLFADLDKLYEIRSSYIKNIELLKQALLQRMFI
ncbi:restriction endonuclease subunit S, partial [Psittacicella melopsittaci]